MAIDITMKIGTLDISNRLLTFREDTIIDYSEVITTLDGKEHAYPSKARLVVNFSLMPGEAKDDVSLYNELSNHFVSATFPHLGTQVTKQMRVMSNIESKFLLKSVDGRIRYSGAPIELREV